ncbi:MAG: SGNH/GDSL hydrolase family protein [Clostridia bacterium]
MNNNKLKAVIAISLLVTLIATMSGCKKKDEEVVILDDSSKNSSSSESQKPPESSSTPVAPSKADSSTSTPSTPPSTKPTSTSSVDFSRDGFSLKGKFTNAILPETADAGEDYINKIVFVGDSTTYGLKAYKMIKNTNNVWTPKSGTIMLTEANTSAGKIVYTDKNGSESEMMIKDAAALSKPEYMVLTLGTNGISMYIDKNTDYYVSEYEKLINSIKEASPNTKIIIQTAFPICSYYKNIDTISNERVNKANYLFADLAQRIGVKFLDTATVLKNDKGYMENSICNGDGIHLNEEGFKLELDYIRTHAYK